MATYDISTNVPSNRFAVGDILNCPYSGNVQNIILPKGTYKLECWGAQGGASYNTTAAGGNGGYSVGTLTLDAKTSLYLYAGGAGSTSSSTGIITTGGFNGGGNGGYNRGGSGGGGSDIRIGTDSLYARVIVAGGGGGGAYYSGYYGGTGGGASGTQGKGYNTTYYAGAATATAGGAGNGYTGYKGSDGAFGQGGNAATGSSSYNRGAGGGGGWYGGGGSGYRSSSSYYYYGTSGGGGGSGYVYTSSTASNYPSGCLLNTYYYLTDASTINGTTSFTDYDGTTVTGHSGDGACRITVLEIEYEPIIKGMWLKTDEDTWKALLGGG